MKRIAFLAFLLVAASHREQQADGLLRQGNEAARRKAWAEAARLYELAEAWAEEPGLVAFNLATARYHLAEAGDVNSLAGAEAGFRACLEGPRRGRALLGLGNCLLLRAIGPGSLDPVALRAAIDRYDDSLNEPDVDIGKAIHNRERARLLLLQAVARPNSPPQEGGDIPGEEKDPVTTSKDADGKAVKEPAPANGDENSPKGEDGLGKGTAGKGMLPPVPDQENAPLIGKAEAAEHLHGATRRILEEWRAHRRSLSRPVTTGRDW